MVNGLCGNGDFEALNVRAEGASSAKILSSECAGKIRYSPAFVLVDASVIVCGKRMTDDTSGARMAKNFGETSVRTGAIDGAFGSLSKPSRGPSPPGKAIDEL